MEIKKTNKDYKLNFNALSGNTMDVFHNKLDITWASMDPEFGYMATKQSEFDVLSHKIGFRRWDKIPAEPIDIRHENCDQSVIYQYNNEYYRCDDFTDIHKGLHILFAGCSDSEGVGGNIEDSWTYQVFKNIKVNKDISGFFSIARAGFGWQKIISNFLIYISKYGKPDIFMVMMPNIGRGYRYINEDSNEYRYFQLYPSSYSYNIDNELYSVNGSKYKNKNTTIKEDSFINVEDYMKELIDFKITWNLFETLCKNMNIKLMWTTWNSIDNKNFVNFNSHSFFEIIKDGAIENFIIKNRPNGKLEKYDMLLRDGHPGILVKKYWAESFIERLQFEGVL